MLLPDDEHHAGDRRFFLQGERVIEARVALEQDLLGHESTVPHPPLPCRSAGPHCGWAMDIVLLFIVLLGAIGFTGHA